MATKQASDVEGGDVLLVPSGTFYVDAVYPSGSQVIFQGNLISDEVVGPVWTVQLFDLTDTVTLP